MKNITLYLTLFVQVFAFVQVHNQLTQEEFSQIKIGLAQESFSRIYEFDGNVERLEVDLFTDLDKKFYSDPDSGLDVWETNATTSGIYLFLLMRYLRI